MQNKFLRFTIISISLGVFISLKSFSISQNTSTSPYSSYGFGEREGLDHAIFAGIGNTKITYFDSTTLNFFNPASYNTIAKGQPIFSTGISSRLSLYKEGNTSNFLKAILLNHFSMALSFAKHFGLAIGLKPFSRRGYEFFTKELLVTDSIQHTYLGSGSTNEAFLGISSNLFKFKNSQLAIGGNVGYVFGTLTNERRSNLIGSTSGGIDQKTLKINAFHYEIGMYYKQEINRKNSLTISAVVEPSQVFNSYQQTNLFNSKFIDNSLYYNKLDSTDFIKGTIKIAPSSTIGLNYSFKFRDIKKETQIRNSEISFHSSFNKTNWSSYRSTFSNVESNPNYKNTDKLTIGIQYIPEVSFLGQVGTTNFFETIRYRVGYYQYSLPIIVNGLSITDIGTTIGFGLPIRIQKSLSSVNLGFTYGKRSNGVKTALNEQYYGINLSVIFAPANFERWFVKRKLD